MSDIKHKPVYMYAWVIKEGLCYYAERNKNKLGMKPSPEAVKRRCVLMLESDYRSLLKAANQANQQREVGL
jgi:hypothetical protein